MSIRRRFRQSTYTGLAYLSKGGDCLSIALVGGLWLKDRLRNPLSVIKIPHCYLLFAICFLRIPYCHLKPSMLRNPKSANRGRQHTAGSPLVIALLQLSLYTRFATTASDCPSLGRMPSSGPGNCGWRLGQVTRRRRQELQLCGGVCRRRGRASTVHSAAVHSAVLTWVDDVPSTWATLQMSV